MVISAVTSLYCEGCIKEGTISIRWYPRSRIFEWKLLP